MNGKQLLTLGIAVFVITAMMTFQSLENGTKKDFQLTESDVGKMCLSGSLMIGNRGMERHKPIINESNIKEDVGKEIKGNVENLEKENKEPITNTVKKEVSTAESPTVVDTQDPINPSPQTIKIDNSKPVVIIYHTHATESYQPVSDGNFHVLQEEGTVREVGDVLTRELEKQGFQVVHDKTIHDNPSYNQSYSRSLKTINCLLGKYKNVAMVIDLHRDAAGYSGNSGKTTIVNGETVAKYSLVVGNGNPNAEKLKIFANAVNRKAEETYPGYGGRIIEKAYKFNQYVSDYYLLLEVGNNENNIREAKASAKYLADVFAKVINDCSN